MSPYDEIHDESGAMRLPYAALETRAGARVTQPPAPQVEELGRRGVVGSRAIFPVPLVLDEAEFESVLAPGVLQRAFALQSLFADIVLGTGRVVESGLLSREDLMAILASESEDHDALRDLWRGRQRDDVTFVYAPDLVRDPSGRWLVLEDNIGCVGGVADGPVVLKRFLDVSGLSLRSAVPHRSALADALSAYLDRVGLSRSDDGLFGIPGTRSQCSGPEFQTAWKAEILRELGIAAYQPEELLAGLLGGEFRPSALINLSATQASAFKDLARKVFTNSDLPTFGAPCVGVVASKSFHALGDGIVSLYLDERPVLGTPPTRLMGDIPDALPEEGVLKRSSGCGGTEVFFLDELQGEADRHALLARVRSWGPCAAVVQERVHRSVIEPVGGIAEIAAAVEIRLVVYVYGWMSAGVDQIVSGRATTPRPERLGGPTRDVLHLPVVLEAVGQALSSHTNHHVSSEQRHGEGPAE
jgi:hypothetical protein